MVAGLTAPPASAQTPLAEVIPTMLGPEMTIAPGSGGSHARDFALEFGEPNLAPTGSFSASLEAILGLVNMPRGAAFNTGIVEQLTTFPIGSSSGGFIYGFDPALGTFVRSTRSFGPSYSERPLTSGRRTLSVGFSVQSVDYDRFDGNRIDGDDVRFYFVHRDLNVSTPLALTPERSDVLEATLKLRISSRTTLTSVTYGVTDRLDIGVTIPYMSTTLEATVDKRILRLGTAADPTIHSFDGLGASTATATSGGTASGLGDLRFQAKYNVLNRRTFAAGALWDVRLPTGDSRNLLGTGTLRWISSASRMTRSISPAASIGRCLHG